MPFDNGEAGSTSFLDQPDGADSKIIKMHDSGDGNEDPGNGSQPVETQTQVGDDWFKPLQIDLDNLTYPLLDYTDPKSHNTSNTTTITQSDGTSDMLFSPLVGAQNSSSLAYNPEVHVSPYIEPGLASVSGHNSLANSSANTPYLRGHKDSSDSMRKRRSTNVLNQYSPLTSPAIAPTASKVIKSSPRINPVSAVPRRSSARTSSASNENSENNGAQWEDYLFKLPDSSMANIRRNETDTSASSSASSSTTSSTSKINGVHSNTKNITPAMLMNYPKVILPSHSSRSQSTGSNHTVSTGHHLDISPRDSATELDTDARELESDTKRKVIRATESPVIQPRQQIPQRRSRHNSKTKPLSQQQISQLQDDFDSHTRRTSSTKSNPLSRMASNENEEEQMDHFEGSIRINELQRKEEHKTAEKCRRNRLNKAVHDLNLLLPQSLKNTVNIPSKATTIELACVYIRQLLAERQQQDNEDTS